MAYELGDKCWGFKMHPDVQGRPGYSDAYEHLIQPEENKLLHQVGGVCVFSASALTLVPLLWGTHRENTWNQMSCIGKGTGGAGYSFPHSYSSAFVLFSFTVTKYPREIH